MLQVQLALYKFYKLTPHGSEVKASWGRMGVNKGDRFGEKSFMYSMSMFWIKYQEKLAKGYVDQTSLYITDEVSKPKDVIIEKEEKDSISRMLYNKLRALSKKAVERAKVNVPITQPIINESKRLLNEMRLSSNV